MSEIEFQKVAPAFACRDFSAMIAFYMNVMGFEERYKSEVYCVLVRGEASIHLYAERDGFKGGQGSAYFFVTGVDEIFDSLKAADGVKVIHPLGDQKYGLRDFLISDLEGNHIGIAEQLKE